jgi:hypothetical protein
VFVDALTTDFDLNVLHQDVAQPVQPPESGVVGNAHRGQGHTEVHAVNQITVTADGASAVSLQIYYFCRPDCILSGH